MCRAFTLSVIQPAIKIIINHFCEHKSTENICKGPETLRSNSPTKDFHHRYYIPTPIIKSPHVSSHHQPPSVCPPAAILPQCFNTVKQDYLNQGTLCSHLTKYSSRFSKAVMHMRHWLISNYPLLDNLAQNPRWTLFQTNFCTETYLGMQKLIIGAFHVIERRMKELMLYLVWNELFQLQLQWHRHLWFLSLF